MHLAPLLTLGSAGVHIDHDSVMLLLAAHDRILWTLSGADWGFQPAKTPTKQSGAQLPVSGASSPLAAAAAVKPGPGSPAWQAWPGGGSNRETPVRQAASGGDATRDPVCAPPPRHQSHVQSISRLIGSSAVSGASSVCGANEVLHWSLSIEMFSARLNACWGAGSDQLSLPMHRWPRGRVLLTTGCRSVAWPAGEAGLHLGGAYLTADRSR